MNVLKKLSWNKSRALLGLIIFLSHYCLLGEAATLSITGGGSTFAAPLYSKWAANYRQVDESVEINYQPTGSAAGVRQFVAETTFFGASDDPMKESEIMQAKWPILQIPTVIGAVVITYNLPNVSVSLKMDGELIGAIFSGQVIKWNDARIQKLNPKVTLPDLPIVVAYRSDGSGTTAVFSEYLSLKTKDWKNKFGQGKSIKFAVGLGGKGNDGVLGLVRQNPGAIGYMEMTFAMANKLTMASIKNNNGIFVEPSVKALTAAASDITKIKDMRVSLLGSLDKGSYPISSFTYILLRQKMQKESGQKLIGFLNWALNQGQTTATELHYGALPKIFREAALKSLSTVKFE